MISAINISKRYGKKEILKNVSIEAKPGQIVSIIGKNGCGKTTLLEILAGVSKADTGEISVFNKTAYKDKHVFDKYIGFIPQDNPLLSDLTVKDNIRFWTSGIKNADLSLLEKYDLKNIMNYKVNELSGGMRRRLAIVCAMIRKHPILILDEPTSSLDMYYQNTIWNSLVEFKNSNGIVLLSTHNINEIQNSDVCYLFDDKRIIRYNKQDIDLNTINKIITNNSILKKEG